MISTDLDSHQSSKVRSTLKSCVSNCRWLARKRADLGQIDQKLQFGGVICSERILISRFHWKFLIEFDVGGYFYK